MTLPDSLNKRNLDLNHSFPFYYYYYNYIKGYTSSIGKAMRSDGPKDVIFVPVPHGCCPSLFLSCPGVRRKLPCPIPAP